MGLRINEQIACGWYWLVRHPSLSDLNPPMLHTLGATSDINEQSAPCPHSHTDPQNNYYARHLLTGVNLASTRPRNVWSFLMIVKPQNSVPDEAHQPR